MQEVPVLPHGTNCILQAARGGVNAPCRYHCTPLSAPSPFREDLGAYGKGEVLKASLNTHTYPGLIVATKTISITEEAYERLKNLKKNEKTSFSEVIVKDYPVKRKLSEVLAELGDCSDLTDSVEMVSREMRKAKLRKVEF